MQICKSRVRETLRLVIAMAVLCSIAIGPVTKAVAGNTGFVSKNPHDLPPSMERDVSPRSTDPNQPPAYGSDDPKVVVVIFADFQCPGCRRASQATHQIAAEFPGEVRMEFWNLPIPLHKNADLAAAAGIAAQRQGKFWEMHDILFANPKHDQATLEQDAQELGLDITQFKADMNDPLVKERIQKEIELAIALGVTSTPAYVINGKLSNGWGSWLGFRSMVEQELAKSNVLAEQGMDSSEILNQRALDNHKDSEAYEAYRLNVLQPLLTIAKK